MDITSMRYVCAVAKYGTFSQAAAQLYITQPTLSQQIHKLEEELGFLLFLRSTRSVQLTEEGKIFVKKAEIILQMYDDFRDEMKSMSKNQSVNMNVGLMPTFTEYDILTNILKFQDNHPNIVLSCQVSPSMDLINKLQEYKYDIIFAYLTDAQLQTCPKQIEYVILGSDHINVAVNKHNTLSDLPVITLQSLQDAVVLTLEKKSAVERAVLEKMKQFNLAPKRIRTCPSLNALFASVALNQGICFHSSVVGQKNIDDPIVSKNLDPEIEMHASLLYRKNDQNTEAIHLLVEELNIGFAYK